MNLPSTAIVLKYLTDQYELNTTHGLSTAGILLFQDLAVIPFFLVIITLAKVSSQPAGIEVLHGLFKGVITVSLMLVLGRWIIRPICNVIVNTKIRELFTLFALLLTLVGAWLTANVGLTASLGAFIAGVLLSETNFRHQIEIEIRPFRDIFLGIFFISIGMLLDFNAWSQTWSWIILLFAAILLGKALLIYLLGRIFSIDRASALRTAINLAQGGEFGFAILTLALQYNLLSENYAQVILSALILSFAITPLLLQWNKKITKIIYPRSKYQPLETINEKSILTENEFKNHVITCGFGRVGQNIARLLKKENIRYLAADIDPSIINKSQIAGEIVIYGDVTHPDFLPKLRLMSASAVLISTNHVNTSIKVLDIIRHWDDKIPAIVRCKDEAEYDLLKAHKPTEIIVETFEESLTIAFHLLRQLHIPSSEASHLVKQVRSTQYDILRKVFRGGLSENYENAFAETEELLPILLAENSQAAGKRIKDLNLADEDAKIVAIRHHQNSPRTPYPATQLAAGDIVVLFGTSSEIERTEKKLL